MKEPLAVDYITLYCLQVMTESAPRVTSSRPQGTAARNEVHFTVYTVRLARAGRTWTTLLCCGVHTAPDVEPVSQEDPSSHPQDKDCGSCTWLK